MTLSKLMDGIYVTTDGSNGGNHGAIVLEDEVIMVDSGMVHPKSRVTKDFLEKETGLPILKLIFTHYHSDHVFGAQAFEPVSLIASEPMRRGCEENIESDWKIETLKKNYEGMKDERPELWNSLDDLSIRLPDIVFNNQLSLGNNKEITVKLLGGHTAGSSVVTSQPHNTIFVGDLIFNGMFPYAGDRTCHPDRWIMALEEVLALGVENVIPGHGPVCGLKEVEEYVAALIILRDNVKDSLDSGVSVESLLNSDRIPFLFSEGKERFGERSLQHWYQFYGE
ncbi:MAG: MBL fold metallo-hydrolase [Candidatus Thorarchaeota archaeon]|jgi:glyoxylase-like metal-dependent hydrolase (beta-lactamase superfamily II)